MSKCTGAQCPMQVGYDVANCKQEECTYRTVQSECEDHLEKVFAGVKSIIKGYFKDKA